MYRIQEEDIRWFAETFRKNEKTEATIEVYLRSLRKFREWNGHDSEFDKNTIISFKEALREKYKLTTVNTYINALNSFFKAKGWNECCTGTYRIQKKSFRDTGKEITIEEYQRILEAAKRSNNERLFYVIQTLACTGIRVSELPCITVESLKQRRSCVYLKRKYREILIPTKLCGVLQDYCGRHGIKSGSIFVTRAGKPLDRSYVCRQIKTLSEAAQVPPDKLFPHNLRHFFAVNYYHRDHDIVHLADLLGHTSLNTTRMYTQISAEKQMYILDKVEEELIVEKV